MDGLTQQQLTQLVADRDAMKSALNGILGVSVGDSMADYATPITTVGNQLEGMLTLDQSYSIDLTGSGLTTIRSYLFAQTRLTGITIPNTVTTIASAAFYQCTSLSSITLPDSITSIQASAFNGSTGLASVTILATTPPTLANANAFSNTNGCPIYVPTDSVAAYKAATNWSSLSSRIQAIPT